jgi:uncharacterized protein (DUF433 family)
LDLEKAFLRWIGTLVSEPTEMGKSMSEWIVAEPGILGGKPCIRGTRISVEFVLELLASGAAREEILKAYPQIFPEGLTAALQYAV